MNCLRIINEPTAAALAYGLGSAEGKVPLTYTQLTPHPPYTHTLHPHPPYTHPHTNPVSEDTNTPVLITPVLTTPVLITLISTPVLTIPLSAPPCS